MCPTHYFSVYNISANYIIVNIWFHGAKRWVNTLYSGSLHLRHHTLQPSFEFFLTYPRTCRQEHSAHRCLLVHWTCCFALTMHFPCTYTVCTLVQTTSAPTQTSLARLCTSLVQTTSQPCAAWIFEVYLERDVNFGSFEGASSILEALALDAWPCGCEKVNDFYSGC